MQTYDQYKNILHSFVTGSEDFLPTRYLVPEEGWTRYAHAIEFLRSQNSTKGLDFGTGNCTGPILGRLHNIEITGLDIPVCKQSVGCLNGPNRFYKIQEKASEIYSIVIHDTDKTPWPFEDSAFDFVLCFDSLFVDWKEHTDWQVDISNRSPQIISRISEIRRIIKPGGFLLIGPPKDCTSILSFRDLLPAIRIFEWSFHTLKEV